ncbi:MAG: hypothetical protein D8H99_41840 [Streptococcus sp.]|nr:MAG: hypothetical protein D8H99_41840 [Streptococcus sp.]
MIDFDEGFPEFSFNEKIANISLIHLESMQPMTTASTLDEFPGSFAIGVDVDLFNIKSNRKYQIQVFSQNDKQLEEQLVHVSNVCVPEEEFIIYDKGYGISIGSFPFNFTAQFEGGYKISFRLYDIDARKELDEFNRYIYLYKR